MTAEILIKFARKGIILSPEAYDLIKSSKNPINLSSEIIVKLKSGNYSKDMVPVDVDTIMKMEGLNLEMKSPIMDEKPKAVEKPAQIQTKPLETKAPTNKQTGFEPPWTIATTLLCPWDFPGNNTGVDCHFLLLGIFLTQG